MSVIKQELKDGILELTFNRPEKLNALNQGVLQELSTIFTDAKARDDVKGLLITGEGKAFCAGADITQLAECDVNTGYDFARLGQSIFRQLETLGKPSVAAINGYTFGGGCELAMSATFRVGCPEAKMGQPEVKLGVIPGYGGTQRLARLVGKGRALDLCLTGRTIDAETALQWGLLTNVVSAENLLDESRKLLKMVLGMAPLAIQSVMEAIDHGYDLSLPDALHLEAVHFSKVCATRDKQEGTTAFLEKRAADFKGV